MGTRSITHIIDKRGRCIASIYRQMDGYPEGAGLDLARFAASMKIINGIGEERAGEAANGAGCFAAQLVGRLKTSIGSIYLVEPNPNAAEEYTYTMTVGDPGTEIRMTMLGHEDPFNGTAAEFVERFGGQA